MSTVAWLVPSLIEGSGGHRTILQNAEFLAAHGNGTILYLENNNCLLSGESGADAIFRLFGYRFHDVRVGWDNISPVDSVFATIWYSARVVRDLPFSCKKLYFVQDWEACFNPMGDTYLFAENSYRYGLTPITIGRWLPHELKQRFNVDALYFDFCADRSIYARLPNVKRERAIAFIYQPEKPRRGAQMGIEALGIVKYHLPDVRIYLYGSRERGNVWFDHEHLGLLSLEECNALYNRVSVGLCISSSNPSRIPFEMMAAGLPVVELHRSNTLFDLPEDASLLCDQTPESIAEGLVYLLNTPERTQQMEAAAVKFMQQRDLSDGYRQFLDAYGRATQGEADWAAKAAIAPMYSKPPVVATPFISSIPAEIRERLIASKPRLDPITRFKKWTKRNLIKALQ